MSGRLELLNDRVMFILLKDARETGNRMSRLYRKADRRGAHALLCDGQIECRVAAKIGTVADERRVLLRLPVARRLNSVPFVGLMAFRRHVFPFRSKMCFAEEALTSSPVPAFERAARERRTTATRSEV